MIKLNFLDHVAIRVKDLEVSAKWYQKVLGLTRYEVKEWGPYPVMLFAGKSGVALFPEDWDNESEGKGDHFAFNVDNENLEKAKEHFIDLGIEYDFKDHTVFHSLYILDPDGYTVELATLIRNENDFYRLVD